MRPGKKGILFRLHPRNMSKSGDRATRSAWFSPNWNPSVHQSMFSFGWDLFGILRSLQLILYLRWVARVLAVRQRIIECARLDLEHQPLLPSVLHGFDARHAQIASATRPGQTIMPKDPNCSALSSSSTESKTRTIATDFLDTPQLERLQCANYKEQMVFLLRKRGGSVVSDGDFLGRPGISEGAAYEGHRESLYYESFILSLHPCIGYTQLTRDSQLILLLETRWLES